PRRGIPWRWRAPCDGPSTPGARRTSPAACPNARWRCRPRRSKGCWIKSATAARRAALQMLDAVRGGATLQGARDGALANLVERDRRLAYELAAGVLRRRGQLDRMLELATANPRLHDVLRLGAYQLRALARVPAYAAVSTSVELARALAGEKAARYVNQALRKIARETGSGKRETHGATDPSWLVARAQRCFGATDAGRRAAIPPGTIVYAACAAPGGKAVALERGGARVIAGDARRERVGRLVETARRSGVAIRVAVADLLAAPFRSEALAAVLVDAPCSATGTMARHPDARWRVTPRTIARAAARQRALLAAAAALVRPGGLLVSATCSLEP